MRWMSYVMCGLVAAALAGCPSDDDGGEADATSGGDTVVRDVADTAAATDTSDPTVTAPPDTTADAGQDTAGDALADTLADATPDAAADTVADTGVDTLSDTAADTGLDTDVADDADTTTPTADGDRCDEPFVLAVPSEWSSDPSGADPIVVSASTADATNDFDVDDCAGSGFATGAPERVYSLTAPLAGVYDFTLEITTDADLMLYVTEACADPTGTCLAQEDTIAQIEELSLFLNADQTVLVVVDSWSTSPETSDFTLTVAPPCAPSCDSGVCDVGDGCGGTCGCDAGDVCVDGACGEAPAGSVCATAFPLTIVDGVGADAGDLGASTTDYSRADCDMPSSTWGASHPDQAWTFPADAGTWRVTATPDDPDGDLMMYTFVDNACAAGCGFEDDGTRGPVSRDVEVDEGGSEVYFIVDSFDGDGVGPYDVAVCDATCRLDDGETCGVTACGEPCGCEAGERCDEGACVRTPGDACDVARTLDDDGDGTYSGGGELGASAGLSPVYDAETCPSPGFNSGASYVDEVWRFAAPNAGDWEVVVTPTTGSASLQVYAFDDEACDADCVARSDADLRDDNLERIVLEAAAADDAFFIVVDGTTSDPGAYTIEVGPPCEPDCTSAGECGVDDGCFEVCTCGGDDICDTGGALPACVDPAALPGNTCANPFEVSLPSPFEEAFVVEGDTSDATPHLDVVPSDCPGLEFASSGKNDEIYRFTAPEDGVYTFTLEPEVDLMLYVLGTCEDPSGTCLAGSDGTGTGASGQEVLELSLSAGDTVHLVVDAWSSGGAGAYTLTFAPPCTPGGLDDPCADCGCEAGLLCLDGGDELRCAEPPPGDTCERARALEGDVASGYTGTGSIAAGSGLTPQYHAGSCPGVGFASGEASPDEVWSFDPAPDREWRVTVTSDTSDVQVYAFADDDVGGGETGCGADCVARADDGTSGAETIALDATGVERFYVVVDAFSASGAAGEYTVDVCDATCPPGPCGSTNGCGETCGCPSGETCDAGTCVLLEGDSCAAPFTLDVGDGLATASGDLTRPGASPGYSRGACDPDTTSPGWGDTAADQVWHVDNVYGGEWEIIVAPDDLEQDFMVYTYVGAACGVASDGCSLVVDGASGPVSHVVDVAAGDDLYVIVDGFVGVDEGPYEITVAEVVSCQADLNVPAAHDGDLVISEVAPGAHVELFNPTAQDITIEGSTYQLCSIFEYESLSASSVGEGVVVPALGFATVGWPDGFEVGADKGELILYADASFTSDASIIDYLCWGPQPTGGRYNQALGAGVWGGECAAPTGIAEGAVHRLGGVDGTEASHYEDAPPSPMECVSLPAE